MTTTLHTNFVTSGTKASATITFSGVPAADETIVPSLPRMGSLLVGAVAIWKIFTIKPLPKEQHEPDVGRRRFKHGHDTGSSSAAQGILVNEFQHYQEGNNEELSMDTLLDEHRGRSRRCPSS